MRKWTLVEYMELECEGKGIKEARLIRKRWHSTAKYYLRLLEITSDRIAGPPSTGTRVVPVPGFFLRRSAEELCDLYRATKPGRRP